MIETGAATVYRPAPQAYGQVLFRNVYAGDAVQNKSFPGFWLLLSQAAAAGMFAAFVTVAVRLLTSSFPYNFLFAAQLPVSLALGLGVGALKGITIWSAIKLFRRVPAPFVRSVISVLGVAGIWALARILFPPQNPDPEIYAWAVGTSLFAGITIGLVTGSSLRPWHELVRGAEIPGRASAILGGLTGAILRLALSFLFMESVIALIIVFQANGKPTDLFWAVLAVWHFAAGLAVVCLKVKFWQLQILATIVNVPVVMFLVKYQPDLGVAQHIVFAYLDAWIIFLLARWRPVYKLLAFLNEEIHYYLID
ncbi:MAG TPA: hypothetical protein VGJ37_01555 [Pyrinomonadaceae bacterium]|jgi:uncharacterized membrane protein